MTRAAFSTRHPADVILQRFVEGTLDSAGERTRVVSHLVGCLDCARSVRYMSAALRMLRAESGMQREDDAPVSLLQRILTAMAAEQGRSTSASIGGPLPGHVRSRPTWLGRTRPRDAGYP